MNPQEIMIPVIGTAKRGPQILGTPISGLGEAQEL